MKHFRHIFLLALLMSMVVTKSHASDYDAIINGIYYKFYDDKATVTSAFYSYYYSGDLVIPASVTYNGKSYSVTRIGSSAFNGCHGLTSITIPNSVTNIGSSAFYDCTGLTSVTIPESVTSIGWSAFYRCSSLTSITIPNSVTNIGREAFSRTSWYNNQPDGLVYAGKVAYKYKGTMPEGSQIALKEGTLGIAESAFNECSGLTSITIPNSVTNIGSSAFWGCSGLTSITIPNSITSIAYAFRGCTGLTSITIPNSVTSIGNEAFYYCTGLTSVTIPNSVTSIGNDAFYLCSGLTAVNITDLAAWCNISFEDNPLYHAHHLYLNDQEITDLVIPESITGINDHAFGGCTGLTSVTIPESVTSIGDGAFSSCSSLTSITIPNSVLSIGSNAFNGTPWYNNQPDGLVYAGKVAYKYKGTMPANSDIVIEEGTLGIAGGAFKYCRGLTTVTIPESVTSIGSYAFANCSGLTSVAFEDGSQLTSIAGSVFYECYSLTAITIPESVTSIGSSAFDCCHSLTSISIPNSVTSIGENAFYMCSALTSVTIGNSVTSIGGYAFYNCGSLTSITIPNGVTNISDMTFHYCIDLTFISIPNSVTTIGDYAISDCHSLTDVYCYAVNAPLTSNVLRSFEDSPIGSATLHVPAGSLEVYKTTYPWSGFGTIVAIEDNTPTIDFADANVKAICVANWDTDSNGELSEGEAAAVTDLGTVFRNNKQIISFDELKYFTGLTSINYNAFRGCTGLTSIIIPENVTSIGDDAFSGCTSLTSITIPASVTSLGDFAFSSCSSLTNVYCYAEAVPSASDVTFDGTNIGTATLYVPKASLTLYKTTEPWSDFGSIVPIEGFTTYNISDEMASLNITTEESECIVALTHDFNGEWEALYLPFAIDYDAIKADFDLAEIDGVVQNDDDNDGTIDFTVLSIRGFKEQMTEPNTPYLIRAKNTGNQTISFEDITVHPTEEATFDCSSFSTKYEFTGSYNTLDASALAERYSIQNGELVKGTSSLAPCRWYMTATSRKGAPLNLPNKIRIMSVDEVITGVSSLGETEKGAVIYNLNGQRLTKPQKGINIQNGRKVLLK